MLRNLAKGCPTFTTALRPNQSVVLLKNDLRLLQVFINLTVHLRFVCFCHLFFAGGIEREKKQNNFAKQFCKYILFFFT
jgi:hypothetical protein